MENAKLKRADSIFKILLPSIISTISLYFMVLLIFREGGPTLTVLYALSLFIAAGYFVLAAAVMHIISLMKARISPQNAMDAEEMKKKIETLKKLRKKIQEKYYKGELDEKTLERELQKINSKIMLIEADLEKSG